MIYQKRKKSFTYLLTWHIVKKMCSLTHWIQLIFNTRKGPLYNLRTVQALVSLCTCEGRSWPSFSAYRINGYCSIGRRTENAQIRLHGNAVWSGPSLFAYGMRVYFPFSSSNRNVYSVLNISHFIAHYNKHSKNMNLNAYSYLCFVDTNSVQEIIIQKEQ